MNILICYIIIVSYKILKYVFNLINPSQCMLPWITKLSITLVFTYLTTIKDYRLFRNKSTFGTKKIFRNSFQAATVFLNINGNYVEL